MNTTYDTIRVEKENGITWVIFNRPEKRNAMSPQLHFDMDDALAHLAKDDETKVLIITGSGVYRKRQGQGNAKRLVAVP